MIGADGLGIATFDDEADELGEDDEEGEETGKDREASICEAPLLSSSSSLPLEEV